MHARIEQLLSVRDGAPVTASVRQHVAACARCTAEIASLDTMRERLVALPRPESAPRTWEVVQQDVARRVSHERQHRVGARGASAASVAMIVIATAWRLHEPAAPTTSLTMPSPQDARLALAADRLEQLQSQSEALEDLLSELPQQPAIERAGTALPIDRIEAQVQWLDHQILLNDDAGRPDTAEQLWHERVEAMNSLVRLRYADAQRVAM